ncbi:uncharacterized protein LOC121597956 isoform X2 [Anopheles merus]|uniref:uncharacterized protein LOC121597956 isoform X2 n=1 Tax=Anopheles merus TaxID=30066 RepID=UPI001BE40D50|nr:uncharacterized protein LOC121597956 isoform X2 [Anopheles merus]
MNKCTVGRLLICLLIAFIAGAHGASNYLYESEERYPVPASNLLEDDVEDSDRASLTDDGVLENYLQGGGASNSISRNIKSLHCRKNPKRSPVSMNFQSCYIP